MSSSMMRGIQLSTTMRDNLIIEVDGSDNDSDEDTLHIVEDSIEESIAIDDSESDEQAIDLSMSSTKYVSSKSAENGVSEPINFSKFYSASTSNQTDHTYNRTVQLPTLTVTYQPHHFGLTNGISNLANINALNGPSLPHQQNNGISWQIQNTNLNGSIPSISIKISDVAPAINESFVYQCEFCSESFSADQLLIDHCARMHTKDIKCQICDKTFYWEKDLHFHMRKHIKKGRGFKCHVCTGLFLKAADLRDHMKMHDKEGAAGDDLSFSCDICDKIFKTSRLLQEHKRRFFHKQCEVCLDYFSSDATLLQHFSVHVQLPTSTYSCDQCDEVFLKKSLLKVHRDKHRLYVCELCSTEFRRKDDIKSHLRMNCTKRTLFHCPVCNKSFLSESNVKAHINTRHYERNKCEFCSETFLHKSELEEHLTHHNIEHPYQCQICLSPMSSKRIFNFHLKSHNDKTKFKCDKCCRWFQSGHILQNHLKSHSKDTFNCTICSMSFSDPQRLDQHSRSHNEHQFQCDICKRSFRSRHLIFLHMIDTHQSRKSCHICDKEFLNQRRLRTHLKSHYVKVEFPDEACRSEDM